MRGGFSSVLLLMEKQPMAITITTCLGGQYQLQPFPMDHLPSANPLDFLAFWVENIEVARLSEAEASRVQQFMRKHKTDALTDGDLYYTLTSMGLAYCNPFYRNKRGAA